MKHLEIYAHGAAYPKLGSGFAVILLSLNSRWERSFANGNDKANTASLKAVKFGLLSIADAFKNMPVKVYVRNKYIVDMFQKDDDGFYKCFPKSNKEIIEEIRAIIENMDVEIIKNDGEESEKCKTLVEEAVKNNLPVDSRK